MNRMQDVDDEQDQVHTNVGEVPKRSIEDDEIIQKSMQAIENHNKQKDAVVSGPGGMPVNYAGENSGANFLEVKGLPSKSLLYPKGTQISARPMKVLEIKKLSTINEDNADFIVNDTIRRTIRGIKFEDILIADKLFLIMWLRDNSYRDSKYVVEYKCGKCENKGDFHFELSQLEVQYLSDNFTDVITLNNGRKFKYKFLTIGDEIKINRFKENNNSIGEIDSELLTIAYMLDEINVDNKSLLEKYWNITNLSPEEFSYITSYIDKYGMGIKPYINVLCNKCGGSTPVGISFRSDFFFPTYKFE